MALNSIGNLTYINQASSATSALQANNMPQQSPLNQAMFQEQMQKVEEVRPAEQAHKLEDREGNGKREFNENEKNQQKEGEDSNFQEAMLQKDIKVDSNNKEERIISEDEMLMKPENHLLDIRG